MSKKFTEEQYQNIIEKHIGNSNYVDMVNDVIGYVSGIDKISYEEAILLALPTSRDWAHEQFVEKEKKYYWTSKKVNNVGLYKMDGIIFLKERYWAPLTESEIKSWGYNPEMFDKE